MDKVNKSRIYLVGFMGVGKSTIGKVLATNMGYEFVDLDHLFEQKYKLSINDFFSKYGEELFRQLESELLVGTTELEKVIIATGGGTACNHKGIEVMNKHGLTVFLNMPVKALVNRLKHARRKRPLVEGLTDNELEMAVQSRLEKRMPFYTQARITADAFNFKLELLVKQINESE